MAKWSPEEIKQAYKEFDNAKNFNEDAWVKSEVEVRPMELFNLIKDQKRQGLGATFVFADTPEGHSFWWDMYAGKTPLDTPRLKSIYKIITGQDYDSVLVARDFMANLDVENFTAGTDVVNNPSHYGQGKIECIEYIKDFLTEDEYIGYLRGNIAKYLHRWRHKNGIEDLKKAEWYLKELIRAQSND